MSLQYREGTVCQSVDWGWNAQGPLVQAKILHLHPRLHTPFQDETAPDFKGLASGESLCPPSIGLSLFWTSHLAVIPSSGGKRENSESHTLLGRIKSHLAFSAPPPWSSLGSRSHLQEPESGGLHLKLRTSHCTHLQPPTSAPAPETLCHSLQNSGLPRLPAKVYGWRRASVFLPGKLQLCLSKKMRRQTLKEHQSHKRQTRPTPTEEEGRGALRGLGWDRLFTGSISEFCRKWGHYFSIIGKK